MKKLSPKLRINAVLFSYFLICKRKAYLFHFGLGFEHESEFVQIGKFLSESTFSRKKHEIELDRTIVIDWIDWHNKIIHEVKKSRSLETAHIWQVKYYLYYFKKKNITGFSGIINYPLLKKSIEVKLEDQDVAIIENNMFELQQLLQKKTPPPPIKIPPCKKCAYYEFCWIE